MMTLETDLLYDIRAWWRFGARRRPLWQKTPLVKLKLLDGRQARDADVDMALSLFFAFFLFRPIQPDH